MRVSAMELLLNSRRLDLIIKFVYLRDRAKCPSFCRELYAEHIRAFGGFFEEVPSDGRPKVGETAFFESFDRTLESLRATGFDAARGKIPVYPTGEIADGAHRLTAAAYLGLDVETEPRASDNPHAGLFGYQYFLRHGLSEATADFAALEFVRLNPDAHVVNLHCIAPEVRDAEVEAILCKYGMVYYKKSLRPTFAGYVNLKKISYGAFWNRERWIGSAKNGYAGAQRNVRESMGDSPLRVYVFACSSHENVLKAKAEIRSLFGMGNYSVHINDSHEEAVWLAETCFNANSWQIANLRPCEIDTPKLDARLDEFGNLLRSANVDPVDVCAAGSVPMGVLGMRESSDLDYLCAAPSSSPVKTEVYSPHDDQLSHYPAGKETIVYDPRYHFWYRGFKVIAFDVLVAMKEARHEDPKDVRDLRALRRVKEEMRVFGPSLWRRFAAWVYTKNRIGCEREVTLLGLKFRYETARARRRRHATDGRAK